MASIQGVKDKIQGLIDKSNASTGNGDKDLTSAVDALIEKGKSGFFLNIAYGDTAPEDTSKLWLKTSEPSKVIVSSNAEKVEVGGEQNITTLSDVALLTPLGSGACIAVGTKVYLFGGKGSSLSNKIQIFDTVANTVTYAPNDLPTATCDQCCAAVGKYIYLFGGDKSGRKVVKFDTETYEVSNPIPYLTNEYRLRPCCVAYDGKIYIFGAMNQAITCYDPETDTEVVLSVTAPLSKSGSMHAIVGNKCYVLGGGYDKQDVWLFDAEKCQVEDVSPIGEDLIALRNACCVAVGSKIYIFGGLSENSLKLADIVCYDTEANSVEKLSCSLSTEIERMSCTAVGNKVYLLGGYTGVYISTIQCFSSTQLALLVASGAVQIVPNTKNNLFALINTDTVKAEIGVDKVYKGNAESIGEEVEAALYKDGAWTNI